MPHAKIKTHQAKLTLEQLHAELGGKILDNKKEADRLAQAMRHVEAVLKLLDPAYSVRGISVRRRQPNPWFKCGTVFRSAVDEMRRADRPMTVAEVVSAMLATKGVQEPAQASVRALWGAVSASLDNHAGKTVERVGEGMPSRWRILVGL